MIVTINDLKEQYKDYQDIYGKIKRDVESNILFPVVKGIYETNEHTSGHLLSAYIYGPSYLSFEYALSYHNLIPKRLVDRGEVTRAFNGMFSKIIDDRLLREPLFVLKPCVKWN